MTRFGMEEKDFEELAGLIHEVVVKEKDPGENVKSFRRRFSDMRFCFSEKEFDPLIEKLHGLI